MKRYTIKDVAEKAEVSISTVSNVINNTKSVTSATRKKVQSILTELNYTPNIIAQSFRRNKDNTIGVIIPLSQHDIANMYFMSTVFGIEEIIRHKYQLIFSASHENLQDEIAQVKLFSQKRVSGLIIAPSSNSLSYVNDFFPSDFPIAVIDRKVEGIQADAVRTDGYSATKEAVRLLQEHGCRHIGYISGPLNISTAQERFQGYRDALKEGQIPYNASLVGIGTPNHKNGYLLGTDMLHRKVDSIFFANNILAMGTVQLIHEHNIAIPQKLRIVVYDDFYWEQLLNPPLTSIQQPSRQMGRVAAQLLLDRMETPDAQKKTITLQAKLIRRQSL